MIRYAAQSDLAALREHDRHISGDELARGIAAQRVLVMLEQDALAGWLRFSLFWDEIPFLRACSKSVKTPSRHIFSRWAALI